MLATIMPRTPAPLPGGGRARARGRSRAPRAPAIAAACLAIPALAALAPPAEALASLHGTVKLTTEGRTVPTGEVRDAVVYWVPGKGAPGSVAPRPAEIVMRGKEFLPRVVAVTRGSTVRFPNSDPILHNVFSVSPENPFDLGLYRAGPGKAVRFDAAGVVRVFCNVHHAMAAYVLVLDTPWFAAPGADGAFALEGLPEGPGTLHVWHARTEPWSLGLTLPTSDPVVVPLPLTGRRVPPHLDKTGRPYRESRGDRTYR
jgi:plastocyanin